MIDIKEGCQYMITGGTGGIGRILTRHLVKRKANIILLGRKKYTKKELQAMFPDAMEHQIDYYECDITSYDQVTGVKDQFYKKNKSLTGIIHCAGITNDKVFSQLTSEEIIQVMEPKIKGFDCIDLVFKEANLDFILLFSSLSSVLGNVGQSAYSAANGYLDGMARERNKMKVAGERKGLTVSVNWPFWEEGGMQLSELGRQLLLSIIGQSTLNTSEAIRAFETAIRAPYEQMLVSYSNNQKIVELINKQRRFEFSSSPLETKITDAVTIPKGAQVNQITFQLKKIVADILKINIDDIDDETELSELGLDSVVGMQMVEKMLSTFGSRLSPTILFEYPTIKEISAYLLENDFHINEPDTTANGEKNMDFNTVSQHILKQEQDHHDSFFDGMEKLVLEGETGNIEIFVKGTGEPVLFLSGFGMMSNIWKNQLQAFSGRYKCLFAHLPLHGASTLKMDGIYFEKIAEEIKKGLLHHESGRITVIGWSMGGMIAQILTHKYPEIFSRMVLVNSSAGIKEGSAWSLESNLLNYKKDIEGLFTLQKEDGLSEVTKALCLVQKSQTLNLKGKLMYGKAFLGFDYKKCLQEINVPTLVIGSKHDTMIPLDDSFHLSTTIPNTEFILFNKSGHFPFITESNKFNNIVLENLNQKN